MTPDLVTGIYDAGLLDGNVLFAIGVIFLFAFILINFVAVFAGICTYAERKVAGHMQARVGPYVVGPHGILQWLADAVKLILKEDIIPEKADRFLFRAAPYVVFAGSFICWVALPFAPDLSPAALDIGVLYIVAFGSSVVLGILMAGWASGNKWAMFGAMRSAAQIVSYEIPTGLTILAIVMLVGSLNMHEISRAQAVGLPFLGGTDWHLGAASWFIFRYPPFTMIAALILYICALAETNRVPFDIPEAESELVAGYHTEYTGFRFSIFFLSEYANMFVVSAIVATLFLGGWLPAYGKLCGDQFYEATSEKTGSLADKGVTTADGWQFTRQGSVVLVTIQGRPKHSIPLKDGSTVFELTESTGRRATVDGDKIKVEDGKIVSGIWLASLLGEWAPLGRILEGMAWFFFKCFGLIFVMMWLRWTIPRYRVDQLMDLCWKKLTPLAFINFFAVGLLHWAFGG
ncbi:MAG TPA: complex I subunit 1 family protein [Planctomycetota bacterium]|nr:complex I subunit 1 family protein [Planctomycetota bacterium]